MIKLSPKMFVLKCCCCFFFKFNNASGLFPSGSNSSVYSGTSWFLLCLCVTKSIEIMQNTDVSAKVNKITTC